MITKYISHTGVTIEVGDFYGGATDSEGQGEVVTSLEEELNTLKINTNLSVHELSLKAGDLIKMEDGSSKIVKSKHDPDNDNL